MKVNFWYSEEPISLAAAELRHWEAIDFEVAIDWIKSFRSAVFSHKEGLYGQVALRMELSAQQMASVRLGFCWLIGWADYWRLWPKRRLWFRMVKRLGRS